MEKWILDIPVIFIIFNRKNTTTAVFEQIKKVRPRQFFVISDGPRSEKDGEDKLVLQVREVVEDIGWECEVHKNYSDTNMGCDKRIVSGINWAFQYVDKAIILEDDCFPSTQFFEFCKIMLEKYEYEKQIAYISGSISIRGFKTSFDYFYSYYGDTWGWATWKDRWNMYEYGTGEFFRKKDAYMIGIFTKKGRKNFLDDVERHFKRGSFPWDYIWLICTSELLKIVPSKNLTVNIGFSENSTHTAEKPKGYYDVLEKISEDYLHPNKIENMSRYIKAYERKTRYYLWDRIIGKCKYEILKIKRNRLNYKISKCRFLWSILRS